jgi:tetratricopeptide (TPR) repeat protein
MTRTILLLLVAAAAFGGMSVDSLCDRAEHLFFNRHLGAGHLDSAYAMLKQGREEEPDHQRCLYLWSRIHVQKGDDAPDKGTKLSLYCRSKAVAESLQSVNERNPDGHMWWAVAQGRIGQTRGVMNSLFMVPSLKKAFSTVIELDRNYATAYDAYGVLYYELPGIVGGSLGKAEQYLLEGLEIDPDYTVIRLDLAKVYIKQKRWQEAREQLEMLIDTDYPTFPADFVLDDKPEAERLLAEIAER